MGTVQWACPPPIEVRRTLIISELTAEGKQTRPDQTSISAKAEDENEGEHENIFQVCGRKMNLTLGTQELSHACPLDRQAYNLSQESITCAEVPHSRWVVFRLAREIASDRLVLIWQLIGTWRLFMLWDFVVLELTDGQWGSKDESVRRVSFAESIDCLHPD